MLTDVVVVLREQLLAAHLTNASHTAPPPPRPQPGVPAHLQAAAAAAGAGGQRDHIIDPAISGMTAAPQVHTTAAILAQPPQAQVPVGQQDMTGAPPGLDQTGEPRKVYGKRELSSSKRAAQNRAAQVGSSLCLFFFILFYLFFFFFLLFCYGWY